ncbi:carboxylating nicotinate-nucleotide diphosphorylase [Acidaminobacter sp. JC074]|uniref:carboxylating nicotinate-nucleotide diphosphorylase n=1 Tax=Acidaminobacter sp. JC074 TaxID=2530199 RepID=UPI001F100789|nr:carboxylating nicotinate-nucleotide diphosphorylase [Acidaminobacter sp. JC074]MCH4887381.1 carboxylating nicotinate-nucleotide diphosphorylase [Acidaminobacter sp. JC074]
MLSNYKIDPIIIRGLDEDISYVDITSDILLSSKDKCLAEMKTKAQGVVAGLQVAKRVFELVDPDLEVELLAEDGDYVDNQTVIFRVKGSSRSILKGERVALNLMQRMSGIATMSYQYAKEVEEFPMRVVDTRKTTPGLRILEKYAVKLGGCSNHRFNLSDAVMIKDNHIKAVGSITKAVEIAKKEVPHTTKIEVEVESLDQLREALNADADIIMLDNMDNETMAEAVKINQGKAILEASGNVTLERLKSIAEVGVDVVSVGALTHSVTAFDISMNIVK